MSPGNDWRGELAEPALALCALEMVRDGVMITNEAHLIVDVNAAFCEITGYPRSDLLNQQPAMLGSSRHDAGYFRDIWSALAKTGVWEGEVWGRRKNGEDFLTRLEIRAIRGLEGRPERHIAVLTDIHNLYQAREQAARLTHFDTLTELPNRTLLTERLRQASEHGQAQQSVAGADLHGPGRLQGLNDQLRPCGGQQAAADGRPAPAPGGARGDTVARLGGDEFAVIVTGLPNMDELETVANRILTLSAAALRYRGAPASADRQPGHHGISPSTTPIRKPCCATRTGHVPGQAGRPQPLPPVRCRAGPAWPTPGARCWIACGEALDQEELELHYQPKVNLRAAR
jgi:PAS domain S-box-containing protein